ncbi:TPA: hypothetical protein ACH3X3_005491 [Trebouxia sp. C0006]
MWDSALDHLQGLVWHSNLCAWKNLASVALLTACECKSKQHSLRKGLANDISRDKRQVIGHPSEYVCKVCSSLTEAVLYESCSPVTCTANCTGMLTSQYL